MSPLRLKPPAQLDEPLRVFDLGAVAAVFGPFQAVYHAVSNCKVERFRLGERFER